MQLSKAGAGGGVKTVIREILRISIEVSLLATGSDDAPLRPNIVSLQACSSLRHYKHTRRNTSKT